MSRSSKTEATRLPTSRGNGMSFSKIRIRPFTITRATRYIVLHRSLHRHAFRPRFFIDGNTMYRKTMNGVRTAGFRTALTAVGTAGFEGTAGCDIPRRENGDVRSRRHESKYSAVRHLKWWRERCRRGW